MTVCANSVHSKNQLLNESIAPLFTAHQIRTVFVRNIAIQITLWAMSIFIESVILNNYNNFQVVNSTALIGIGIAFILASKVVLGK
jgi:hypothetical protein